MTLTSPTTRLSYNGDGATTSFAVSFTFWDVDDLRVILRDASGTETVWTRGTQYTVSRDTPTGATTGSIEVETTPTDYTPASGETLVILSNLPNTQETSLALGGPFSSATVEQRLDQITRLIQQRSEELDRSLKFAETSSDSGVTFPDVTGNASKLLRINSAADAVEAVDLADIDGTAITTPLEVADGGTGASTASGARTNLGLGALATKSTVATADIDAAAVTYGKIQDVSATSRFLGRITAGAGDVEELTGTQATTLLDTFTSGLQGLVPASGGGAKDILYADGSWARQILRGTAITTTSGTSHDFTGLPSGLDKITLMLSGVSLSGTANLLVQIGDTGGIETSGYNSGSFDGTSDTHVTNGFQISISSAAADDWHGAVNLTRIDGNEWVVEGSINDMGNQNITFSGSKSLSATLDRVRLTTTNGTDTFDAGKINIIYQ